VTARASITIAAALALAGSARAEPQPTLGDAVWLALPALDGRDGVNVGYEHWLPQYRTSWVATAGWRRTATGDYRGTRLGAGGELRWYWRAHSRFSPQPAGSMVGWYLAGRIDLDGDWTYDKADARSLGTGLVVGVSGQIGYRFAPWRGLEITPSTGLELRNERDMSGRLPAWTRAGVLFGTTIGWMY
jgi:hypothetical protein